MNEATQETSAVNDINDWSDVDTGSEVVEDESTETAEDTTSETDEANQAETIEGEADKATETAEKKSEENQTFELKYLGETKAVSRDEIIPLAQKGMDYDRIRSKFEELTTAHETLTSDKSKNDARLTAIDGLAKANGYKDVDDMLDNIEANRISEQQGIDRPTALKQVQIDRRERELAERESKLSAEKSATQNAAESAKKAEEKRTNDFAEFVNEYKDLKPENIPKEVWDIYDKGGRSLIQAYEKVENIRLKAEREAEKKTSENKQKSTGSRASAGNASKADAEDAMWYEKSSKPKNPFV